MRQYGETQEEYEEWKREVAERDAKIALERNDAGLQASAEREERWTNPHTKELKKGKEKLDKRISVIDRLLSKIGIKNKAKQKATKDR